MLTLNSQSRVVVRLPNALGDAVMATACVRRLASVVKPENITLVGPQSALDCFAGLPLFGHTIPYQRKGKDKGFFGLWRKAKEIRALNPDLAVILPNSLSTAMMFFLARTPQCLGYFKEGRKILLTAGRNRPLDSNGKFQAEYTGKYFLKLLDEIDNLPPEQAHPSLALDDQGEAEFSAWAEKSEYDPSKPLAIVVPGAAFGPSKIWIPERYAEVADRLIEERGAQILISYGPGEEGIATSVKQAMKHKPLADARISIRGLKSLYKRASFVLCNDTGPRHFAVAFDVPNVTIMGPNDPAYTYLESEKGEVVREEVDCSPCLLKECPLPEKICMTQLSSNKVLERCLANFPEA